MAETIVCADGFGRESFSRRPGSCLESPGKPQSPFKNGQDRDVFFPIGGALAGDHARQRKYPQGHALQFADSTSLPFHLERTQTIGLKHRVDLRPIAEFIKRPRPNDATQSLHNRETPDVLALGEADPEIVIQRHQRRALLDGSHRANQYEIYLLLVERRKESAKRAVLRLKWHRSWGVMAKNSACCQRSASSIPRAPRSLR